MFWKNKIEEEKKSQEDIVKNNKMIMEITTGQLGTKLKDVSYELYSTDDVDKLYKYDNNNLLIYYNQKGFRSHHSDTMHFSYSVYYCGELVYECSDGVVSKFIRDNSWYDELKAIYTEHIKAVKKMENQRQWEIERLEICSKINKIFGLVGSEGYIDDKIIIDQVEHRIIPAPIWSKSKDQEISNGRILLLDGTVLKDTRKAAYEALLK